MGFRRAPGSTPSIHIMLIGAAVGAAAIGILLLLNLAGIVEGISQVKLIAVGLPPFLLVYGAASTDRRPKASLLQPLPLVVFMLAGVMLSRGFFPTTEGMLIAGGVGLVLGLAFSRFAPRVEQD